jgi:hypothetical protein
MMGMLMVWVWKLICISLRWGMDIGAWRMSITKVSASSQSLAGVGAYGSTAINLSHVITEFSFGPYFPDITQPLDYSYEVTHESLSSSLSYLSYPSHPFT